MGIQEIWVTNVPIMPLHLVDAESPTLGMTYNATREQPHWETGC